MSDSIKPSSKKIRVPQRPIWKGNLVGFLADIHRRRENGKMGDVPVEILVHRPRREPERITGRVQGQIDKDREGVVAVIRSDAAPINPFVYPGLPPLTLGGLMRYSWQMHQCDDAPSLLRVYYGDRTKEFHVCTARSSAQQITLYCRPTKGDKSRSTNEGLHSLDRTHYHLPTPCLRRKLRYSCSDGRLVVLLPGEKARTREPWGPGPSTDESGHGLLELTKPWCGLPAGAVLVDYGVSPPLSDCRRLDVESLRALLPKSEAHTKPAICHVARDGGLYDAYALGKSTDSIRGSDLPLALSLHRIYPDTGEIEECFRALWVGDGDGFESRWGASLAEWVKVPDFREAIEHRIGCLRCDLTLCDPSGQFCRETLRKLKLLSQFGYEVVYSTCQEEFLMPLYALATELDVKWHFDEAYARLARLARG